MQVFIILIFLYFLNFSSSLASPVTSSVNKFLYTNPLGVNFENADKYLERPFAKSKIDKNSQYISLDEKELNRDGFLLKKSILQDKKNGNHKLRLQIRGNKDCRSLIEIIRNSYKKDFTHYIDYSLLKDGFDTAKGTIDFKNYRVSIFCLSTLKSTGDAVSSLGLTSGKKEYIKKVLERNKIECAFNNEINKPFVYQIDNDYKSLLDMHGSEMGKTIRFDSDFIIVSKTGGEGKKDIEITLDRKSGSLQVNSKNSNVSLYGSCKKRSVINKF